MPAPNGPQFRDISEARSFVESLPDRGGPYAREDNPTILNKPTTRALMRAVGIRSWPINHPSDYREYNPGDQGKSYVTRDEPLHTTQDYLHMGTLKRYLKGDIPEFHPDWEPDHEDDFENDVPYHPDVLETHNNRRWIDEGHHRIVTSRLNEHPNIDVNLGSYYRRKFQA